MTQPVKTIRRDGKTYLVITMGNGQEVEIPLGANVHLDNVSVEDGALDVPEPVQRPNTNTVPNPNAPIIPDNFFDDNTFDDEEPNEEPVEEEDFMDYAKIMGGAISETDD